MGSTVGARYASGKVTATNADQAVRVVDFKPKKVSVANETTLAKVDWDASMDDDSGWKTAADGTRTLEAAGGITALDAGTTYPPGFQIGTLADINSVAGQVLHWEAWG